VWVAATLAVLAASCREEVELGPEEPVDGKAAASAPAPAPGTEGVGALVVAEAPELPVKTRDGWLRGQPLPPERRFTLDRYRRLLEGELARYPSRLLEKAGLKAVVIVQDLSFEGADCYSFADVERGRLYLSTRAGLNETYIRRTIHHEVFHQVDFAAHRRLASDPDWEALNPPGFRYSHDAATLQADPEATRPDDAPPGFLNRYATTSPAEDKAEVFAALVTDLDGVTRRADLDPVLRRKIERVRATLDRVEPHARAMIGP
jgi:hypothetical protein